MKIGFDGKRAVLNYTGLGNYSRFVINNLQKFYMNNSYTLFTPKLSKSGIESLNSEVRVVVKQGFKPLWRTFGLTNEIRNEGIDIYHGLSNELPYKIDRLKIKKIVTIHDLIFLRYPQFYSPLDRKIYDIKAKYACRVSDEIIAVSERTKRDIVDYYGIDPNKISVIYQGCLPVFKTKENDSKKSQIIEKYKLPSKFILSVGSIEERKNILLIVKALKYVPEIHFVAVGKQCKYAQLVKDYAAENGLSNRVHFLSNVPFADLPAILQSSEMFIYPSLYEGFGIPIIEALSSGVPVIAAKGSCLEEAGGPDSIYVNPDDYQELALHINTLLHDQKLKAEMIEKGLVYVEQFSEQKCTENLMDVYQRLIIS